MQEQKDIIDCYDKTAENYADKFIDELISDQSDKRETSFHSIKS